MTELCFLGIDLGAESGRVMAALWNGKRIRLQELHRFSNGPVEIAGTLRWDVLRLWSEIQQGLAIAGRDYGKAVRSAGVDTWGVDFTLLSKSNELLSQPYHYRDTRTRGMMAQAFKRVPREEIFAETGLQFMELNTLYQLLALKKNSPEILNAAESLLMMPDFFHWCLTGKRVAEFTDATTTQFFHPTRREWSQDLLNRFGLPTGILPEVVAPGTVLGPMLDATAITAINGKHEQDAFIESAALMQMDLVAFSFASDLYRSASIQIGGANDHTRYTVGTVLAPAYHPVSHRNDSDGQAGPLIANSVQLHHGIDQIHARMFKRLLDKLNAYTLPQGGTLLDSSVNVWTNSLDNGPTHGSNNIPYVLAGGAAGFLKLGVHMVLPMGAANNLVLNTVVSAAGCRKASGDLVDNFGDPAFPGTIPEIIA